MKRFILMIATLAALLCLTGCQKGENFFVGDWHHKEVMEDGVTYDIYLHIHDNGQFNFDWIYSNGWDEESHVSGSWTLVNDEQITATVYYEDGKTTTWTFRKDGKTLYWVEGYYEFHK